MPSATMRPIASTGPPAPNGTTSVIGRDGYDCADAIAFAPIASANASASCFLMRKSHKARRCLDASCRIATAGPMAVLSTALVAPLHRRVRRPRSRAESSHRALIGVDDLASGGEPDAWSLLHVGDGAFQVFDAQWLTADHWVQRNAHDPRVLAAVSVQRIELIDYSTQILLTGVALADVERDVIDFVAVRNREHFARLDLHRIGLVVVVPVTAILHAFFGENVQRIVSLDQPGAEPPPRSLTGRLFDGFEDGTDRVALLLRRKAGECVGVGGAVTHELPPALLHFLDRLGEVAAIGAAAENRTLLEVKVTSGGEPSLQRYPPL